MLRPIIALLALAAFGLPAGAQHLIWMPKPRAQKAVCLYAEVQVIATGPTIYYCACNWWPGNPAGGYTGIQDPGDGRHLMIFSIWDTSPTLHPQTIEADARTKYNRFGGEGEGAHTHLDYDWKVGHVYRTFVTKEQDAAGGNTLTRAYFYDEGLKRWVHEATISSPNDGHESVRTFGGMLNAFLENWSGRERAKPKLALYRLWLGVSPRDLTPVTEARGDGNWGVLNDSFYLAEGDEDALAPIFEQAKKPGMEVVRGKEDRSTLRVTARKVPASVVRALERLPRAPAVKP